MPIAPSPSFNGVYLGGFEPQSAIPGSDDLPLVILPAEQEDLSTGWRDSKCFGIGLSRIADQDMGKIRIAEALCGITQIRRRIDSGIVDLLDRAQSAVITAWAPYLIAHHEVQHGVGSGFDDCDPCPVRQRLRQFHPDHAPRRRV